MSQNRLARLTDLEALETQECPANIVRLDTVTGSANGNGATWDKAVKTMAEALALVRTGGTVLFRGDVREEITGSNLLFDITIKGVGSLHHADLPSAAYHPGASVWRPPASPTQTTPLLAVRGRGWKFENILFDCPVDAAAVQLNSNALSGTSEYDASHARFFNCIFTSGYRAIQDVGGCHSVRIRDCIFREIEETGGCAIVNTSTSVRLPQYWRIENCFFAGVGASGGNESHIDAPLSGGLIANNFFGLVEGTGLYIDLTGGDDNIVFNNLLAGDYTTGDYVAGTNDIWVGNYITSDLGSNTALVTTGSPAAAS